MQFHVVHAELVRCESHRGSPSLSVPMQDNSGQTRADEEWMVPGKRQPPSGRYSRGAGVDDRSDASS
jgi:hypothetical protein